MNAVFSALSRGRKRGEFVRTQHGRYKATKWTSPSSPSPNYEDLFKSDDEEADTTT